MESIKLSPTAISRLLDIDLDYVIFKITGKKANQSQKYDLYVKELKSIRKQYKNELYDISAIPEFENINAVSPDLSHKCVLRELILQCNKHPIALMRKVIDCKKCVELIKFTDKFRFYDMFLTAENQKIILKKVANVHLCEIGDSKTYKDFVSFYSERRRLCASYGMRASNLSQSEKVKAGT
jgi:hypothetical protein